MKSLFWMLFAGTLITAIIMRYDSKRSSAIDFNIMRFEYPKDRAELNALIGEWSQDLEKAGLLRTQLRLDYIFMSLLFPAIFVLCFWARHRWLIRVNQGKFSMFLEWIGWAQLLAWFFDFVENVRLEKWLERGGVDHIFLFKEIVFTKFAIGIAGFLVACGTFIYLAYHK